MYKLMDVGNEQHIAETRKEVKAMVRINGEDVNAEGMNLKACLEQHGYNLTRIAVEINENIVPKTVYEETVLKAGDCVEVVSFVGGG